MLKFLQLKSLVLKGITVLIQKICMVCVINETSRSFRPHHKFALKSATVKKCGTIS